MSSDTRPCGCRPDFLLDPLVAFAFWTLAVATLLNVEGLHPGIDNWHAHALASILSLLVAGMVHVRPSRALGIPGALILAAVASYLSIGYMVAVATGAETRVDLYQDAMFAMGFLGVTLAAALGSRAILERVGTEALLKSVLTILMVSCIVVLASPVLSDLGLPRLEFRIRGAFADPNDAGLIGCMTTVLALAFLGNTRQHLLAYLGLTVGFLTVGASVSKTGIISLSAVWVYFLLLSGRGGRGPILLWLGGLILCLAMASTAIPKLISLQPGHLERADEIAMLASGGVINDDVLTRRGTLWKLGMRRALESPVVGHGLGRLSRLDGAPSNLGVHNMYLKMLGEAGIVPLSLYLLYLLSLLWLGWTAPKSLAGKMIVGWVIVVVAFSFSFHHLLSLKFFAFLTGLTCVMATDLDRGPASKPAAREVGHAAG